MQETSSLMVATVEAFQQRCYEQIFHTPTVTIQNSTPTLPRSSACSQFISLNRMFLDGYVQIVTPTLSLGVGVGFWPYPNAVGDRWGLTTPLNVQYYRHLLLPYEVIFLLIVGLGVVLFFFQDMQLLIVYLQTRYHYTMAFQTGHQTGQSNILSQHSGNQSLQFTAKNCLKTFTTVLKTVNRPQAIRSSNTTSTFKQGLIIYCSTNSQCVSLVYNFFVIIFFSSFFFGT